MAESATPKFTDPTGRTWYLSLTVGSIKRVRELTGVDLLKLDDQLLTRLSDDPELLGDVLYAACRSQCLEHQVSDSEFGELLAGDVLEQAVESLIEALICFFPRGRREVALKLNEQRKTKQSKLLEKISNSPKLDQLMDRYFEQAEAQMDRDLTGLIHGARSTKSPESAESTPSD